MTANYPDPERLQDLFHQAIERPVSERGAFLDGIDDRKMRARIQRLLEAALELDAATATGAPNVVEPVEGGVLDNEFELVCVLGHGGMGSVYLAKQQSPQRPVAIKLLGPHGFPNPDSRRRFEIEAEALARLNHPHVAQIYTASEGELRLPGGRSKHVRYLAMESVDGVHLTDFVQTHALSVHDRIELIEQIAAGVQHAHQQGVIHRDLKPANVLVTAQGHAKVVDFGISRLDTGAQATRDHTILGTLGYMSPEQASAGPVDTRTDIYTLAVLAFEILTGELPVSVRGLPTTEALAKVARTDASRAAVGADLPTDVQAVLGKALRHGAAERYATAHEFAAELRRFRENRPVLARPATTVYQLRKFVARNRAFSSAVAVAATSLVVGILATSWALVRAQEAEADVRAALVASNAARDDLRAAHRFLTEDLLASATPGGLGSGVSLADSLAAALPRVGVRFGQRPRSEAAVRETAGVVLATLEDYDRALQEIERALELRRGHPESDPIDELRLESLHWEVREQRGDSLTQVEPLRTLVDRIAEFMPPQPSLHATTVRVLGRILRNQGHPGDAAAALQSALPRPDSPLWNTAQNRLSRQELAISLDKQGDRSRAIEILQELVDTSPQSGDENRNAPSEILLRSTLGLYLKESGDLAGARTVLEPALTEAEEIFSPDHSYLATVRENLALVFDDSGEHRRAQSMLQQVAASFAATSGPEDRRTLNARANLAASYGRSGDHQRALDILDDVVELHTLRYGDTDLHSMLFAAGRSQMLWALGRRTETVQVLRGIHDAHVRAYGERDIRTMQRAIELAQTLGTLQRFADAESLLLPVAEYLHTHRSEHSPTARRAATVLSAVYNKLGDDAGRDRWAARAKQD